MSNIKHFTAKHQARFAVKLYSFQDDMFGNQGQLNHTAVLFACRV